MIPTMKKPNAVDSMLMQRAEAPSAADQGFIRCRPSALNSARQMVSAPHPWRWITLDPAWAGYMIQIRLGGPDSPLVLTCVPGVWVPIAGYEVYAAGRSLNSDAVTVDNDPTQTIETTLARDMVFWLSSLESPPALNAQGYIGPTIPEAATVYVPGASAPSSGSDGRAIPPGATHVTLHFTDEGGLGIDRIVGAEIGSYEVWWCFADGVWGHHPNDDFDVAGRQQAEGAHDVEVYEVPRNVSRVYVRYVSGSSFAVWVIPSFGVR